MSLFHSAFVGIGPREGGQEETGEPGSLFDARGGEIKRGNVTCERGTLKKTKQNVFKM